MADYKIPIYQVMLVRDGTQTADTNAISNPGQAAKILQEYLGDCLDREHFVILMLNTKNKPIGIHTVSIGSLSSSIVHPREIMKPAILASASCLIICHNHPSGDPTPSQEDMAVTKRLVDAGNVMGIAIRDHVILGDDSHFSFREKGLI